MSIFCRFIIISLYSFGCDVPQYHYIFVIDSVYCFVFLLEFI